MYVNEDKEKLIFTLATITGSVRAEFSEWEKFLTKDGVRYLKTAMTYLDKSLDDVFTRLNDIQTAKIYEDVKNSAFKIFPKGELYDRMKKAKQEEGMAMIEKDALETILELAMVQSCKPCTIKNFKACNYRRMYLIMGAPILDDTPGKCPYK